MRIRNQRAAKEKAIEYSSRYLNDYSSLNGAWFDYRKKHSLPSYEGPIGDFTLKSVPPKYEAPLMARWGSLAWGQSINELAAIAAAFTSGVADEEEGFKSRLLTFTGFGSLA
jgi:hypothetical protein